MSPKELLYLEDALEHEQFLKTQCQQALNALTDPDLKAHVQQMMQKHQQVFSSLFQTI